MNDDRSAVSPPAGVLDEVREYWDADAATYDHAPGHGAPTRVERAAWTAALARHLPASPSRVLDVGSGTGFLSLGAARLGHDVTAVDLSAGMLAKLRARAEAENLAVTAIQAPADEPPAGPFDAVLERHLLWTLPDPAATLRAWREAAPSGRLVLFESLWGRADPIERGRARLHTALRTLRRTPPHHHDEYGPDLLARLPLAGGAHPERLLELVEAAGWRDAALTRLRDVEWARRLMMNPVERALGFPPCYALVALAARRARTSG